MYRLKTWPERESAKFYPQKQHASYYWNSFIWLFQLEAGLIQLRMEVASKRVSQVRIFAVFFLKS